MKHSTGLLLLVVLSLALASCQKIAEITSRAESIDEQAAETVQQHYPGQPQPDLLTSEINSSYLGSRQPVQVVSESPPPPALQKQTDLTFVEPVTLTRLAQLISDHTGVHIEVDAELASASLDSFEWSGTAADVLDSLTASLGAFWRVRQQRILIFRTELAAWTIYAPNTVAQWQASVGLSGSATATGGGADLQASDRVGMSLDTSEFWSQLEATVAALLTPAGRATLNAQTGELTVVDTPPSLARIDRWVSQKNREFSTQVVIHVELYEIARSANAIQGVNFEGLFQEAVGNKAVRINFGTDDSGQLVGLRYSRSDTAAIDEANIALLLRLAAGDDQVSKLTSTVLRATNGQPVPVFFGDETSYLQRREIIESDTRVSVRLVPGTLQDGIALNLVPRILPDTDRLALNITLRTSRIKQIARFPADAGPDDPVIQLPDLESRSILLPVLLRSGETLFVAGLDTSRSTARDSSAILSKENRRTTNKNSLVLLITPKIITPLAAVPTRRYLGS